MRVHDYSKRFNYVKSERDDISDIENKIDRKCARIFAVK